MIQNGNPFSKQNEHHEASEAELQVKMAGAESSKTSRVPMKNCSFGHKSEAQSQ
jgi:hypothetical protein